MSALEVFRDDFLAGLTTDESEAVDNRQISMIARNSLLANPFLVVDLDPTPFTLRSPSCLIVKFKWEEPEPRRGIVVGSIMGLTSRFLEPEFEPEVPIKRDAIIDEAREEGFTIPSKATLERAESISSKLLELGVSRLDVAVYPTRDGGVTVDVFRGPEGERSSILFLCKGPTGIECLTHIREKTDEQKIRFDNFPDEFVRRYVKELMEVS